MQTPRAKVLLIINAAQPLDDADRLNERCLKKYHFYTKKSIQTFSWLSETRRVRLLNIFLKRPTYRTKCRSQSSAIKRENISSRYRVRVLFRRVERMCPLTIHGPAWRGTRRADLRNKYKVNWDGRIGTVAILGTFDGRIVSQIYNIETYSTRQARRWPI